jgi:uncharacterized membrane protein
MDYVWWWVMDVILPVILLILLAWLAFWAWRQRRPGDTRRAEKGTRDLYEEEERRRREGTDDL